MRKLTPLLAATCLFSGCAALRPPPTDAHGPTLPTGSYDSEAEQWADETLAAQRNAQKDATEQSLRRMNRR